MYDLEYAVVIGLYVIISGWINLRHDALAHSPPK